MEGTDPETLTAIDERVYRDKLAKYLGSARVWITHLDFPYPSRQINRRIITQLKRDFDGEGCIKEQPDHRIPAVIDNSVLRAGLQRLAISTETFRATSKDNPPQLHLGSGIKLECLHGQHRVVAAKEHLVPSLRWWIVDLYSSDLEKDTKQTLREGYSYSAKYTSGEIFRYIRLCNYDNDTIGVQRWRGRLSNSQNLFLTQLLKRGILISALDSVLHIQGLWRTFYLGSLDVFLNLKCDDEIARCIKTIKRVLTHIFGDEMVTIINTDPFTIESIQSRAPALSKSDFEFIQEEIPRLFAAVTDPVQRADITQRLLATEEPIPTLYTLIKDIRYLKQPAAILTTLLPKSRKPSLRQRFYFHFAGVERSRPTIEVEQNVASYTSIPNSHLDAFDLSYQQLWLCACRVWKNPNTYGRLQLATLAHILGFSSAEIERELSKDPDRAVIEKAVLEALNILRPNQKFAFDANKARELIASFHDYLGKVLQTPAKSIPPFITVAGPGEPLARRCGHSSADTRDLEHLFLEKIHAPLQDYQKGGDEISSFHVKRSRHRAFFGEVNLAGNRQDQSTHSAPAEALVEQQIIVLAPSPSELSGPAWAGEGRDSNPNESSQSQTANQVVQSAGRVVRFKERDVAIQEVPYEKEAVNEQARVYANQGKKLSVQGSGHFIWQDCFDILYRTKQSTVHVFTTVQPVNGKRRYDQELPEILQPVTKKAFDFEMEDSEEEL